jgi:GTP-binding protein YchF
MKIALIGLTNVGKKTCFSLLTGVTLDQLRAHGSDYAVGIVKVADPRVDKLSAMYRPKKTKYAEIECTLAPPPPHETKQREQWLNKLKEMDAFCHIVRAFDDPTVPHASGSVDALRDIEAVNLELAISDLSLVELRLTRIAAEQKRKHDAERAKEAELLAKLKPHLEAGKSLREFPLTDDEIKRLRTLQFLTMKGIVVVLNLGENNFPNPALMESARKLLAGPRAQVGQLCAKVEMEVSQIENPVERAEFLAALGIAEPAIHVLSRLLYTALGYISFFTTGEDEVRAWTVRRGATAVEAAHAIHSDIARNFIRAEVMKYEELVAAGETGHAAELKLKETGKLHLKGKDYLVEDGDILHFRHSG